MRFIAAFLAFFFGFSAHAQSPFTAVTAATVALAVTAVSARAAVAVDAFNPVVRLYNAGTVPVFIACGDVTVVAAIATGLPVVPGTVEVLGCNKGGYIAGITASGTATLYVTPGSGL